MALARRAGERIDRAGRHGRSSFSGIMMQTVADWWLGAVSGPDDMRGWHYATSRRKQALYYLIVGQLLMSCKMRQALEYLDKGRRLADGLITAGDYFTLYNRHEELRHLHVSEQRQKAHDLPALLNESRVIRRLAKHPQYTRPTR